VGTDGRGGGSPAGTVAVSDDDAGGGGGDNGEDVGVGKEPSFQTDMQHDPLC
jgi:hypothetical protein